MYLLKNVNFLQSFIYWWIVECYGPKKVVQFKEAFPLFTLKAKIHIFLKFRKEYSTAQSGCKSNKEFFIKKMI